MSYTNLVKDADGNVTMAVHVICKANPQGTYDKYAKDIEKRIINDGYIPKTTMDNLICHVILSFDCDDNYGEFDEETGFGGYGKEFTLKECFNYVEDSGGWREFDYYS